MKTKLLLICALLMLIPTKRIDVFVFHTETCSVCVKTMDFLNEASKMYPTMVIHAYDISQEENKKLYDLFKQVYSLDIKGYPVPIVFIGKDFFRGYSAVNVELMQKKLAGCMKETCTISLCEENDCIVIVDPTPTPELTGIVTLLPLLVIAGIICGLNPLNAEIVNKIKTKKGSLFFVGYFVTSVLLCFALSNVLFLLDNLGSMRILFMIIAVILGVLSLASLKVKGLGVPASSQKSMDLLAQEGSGFSFLSLGVGVCLLSLMYTCGIFLLVVYNMGSFFVVDRLLNFAVFSASALFVLLALYKVKPKKKDVFVIIMGLGSVALGLYWWVM